MSRNKNKFLTVSSDTLKQNLAKYLGQYRLVNDAVDILDAKIINFGIDYKVTVKEGFIPEVVIENVNNKIKRYFKIENMHIDKPIKTGDITNIIINTNGVDNLVGRINFVSKNSPNSSQYNTHNWSSNQTIDKGYLFPPEGGIFELKYPNSDITGTVI